MPTPRGETASLLQQSRDATRSPGSVTEGDASTTSRRIPLARICYEPYRWLATARPQIIVYS